MPINVSFVSGQLGPATKHQLSPIGRMSSPQLQPRPIRGQIGGTEKARCGSRSTPSRLRSSHPPRCFCQIAKITRKSEAQLAATAVQDVMRWRVQTRRMWERPVPPADACGFSGDTWAPRQMWGNTAQEQVWVGPHVWMQPGQKTNRVYLANLSPTAPTHIRTQEQTGAGMLTRRTPGEETCLTQSCVCLLPACFEMSVFPSGALRDWSHV